MIPPLPRGKTSPPILPEKINTPARPVTAVGIHIKIQMRLAGNFSLVEATRATLPPQRVVQQLVAGEWLFLA